MFSLIISCTLYNNLCGNKAKEIHCPWAADACTFVQCSTTPSDDSTALNWDHFVISNYSPFETLCLDGLYMKYKVRESRGFLYNALKLHCKCLLGGGCLLCICAEEGKWQWIMHIIMKVKEEALCLYLMWHKKITHLLLFIFFHFHPPGWEYENLYLALCINDSAVRLEVLINNSWRWFFLQIVQVPGGNCPNHHGCYQMAKNSRAADTRPRRRYATVLASCCDALINYMSSATFHHSGPLDSALL